MAELWITELDELDSFSTVLSSSQKQQLQQELQNYYNSENKKMAQKSYQYTAQGLREVRRTLYRYLEIEYVIYHDLKQDVFGDVSQHYERLDELLGLVFGDFYQNNYAEDICIQFIWFDRYENSRLTKEERKKILIAKNDEKRQSEIKKYFDMNFSEIAELLQNSVDNDFFIHVILGYFQEIYKFIFKTRPYLYPDYDYQKSIPFDESSENDWFFKKKSEKESLPRELDTYLLSAITNKESKYNTENIKNNVIINSDYEELHAQLPDNSIDIVLTDPPYFINYAGNSWDNELDESEKGLFFENYFKSLMPKLKSEAVLLVFNDYSNIEIIEKSILSAYSKYYYDSNKDVLEDTKEEIMQNLKTNNHFTILPYLEWAKTNPRPSIHFNKHSEYVVVAVSGYKQFNNMLDVYDYIALKRVKEDKTFLKELNEDSIDYENLLDNLDYNNLDLIDNSFEESSEIYNSLFSPKAYQVDNIIHDTPKPAQMLNKLLKRFSKPGMTVLDSFSGSGAITLAAYELGLNSIACERDDYMTLISRNRLADFSRLIGQKLICLRSKELKNSLYDYDGYKLFKEGMTNYFYIPINRLETKSEKVRFLESRLLKIKEKAYTKKKVGLVNEKLSYEDHCFLIGFNEIYNTKEFYSVFGESGRNKEKFFGSDSDKRHAVNLACRYFNKFKQNVYAGDYILYLYDCSYSFKNWKNLDKETRNKRLESYLRYLYELISDLLMLDSMIINIVKDIKIVSKKDKNYRKVYYYYFTLTLATRYYYRLITELEVAEKKGYKGNNHFKQCRYTSEEIANSSELFKYEKLKEFNEYIQSEYNNKFFSKSNSDIKLKPAHDAIRYYLEHVKTKHINIEYLNPVNVFKNISIKKNDIRRKITNKKGEEKGGLNLVSLQSNLYITSNDREELRKKILIEKNKINEEFDQIKNV